MGNFLVVGAGLSGSTIARLLADSGHSVEVIDRRSHIAGNAYDFLNEYGIRVHQYGPHIFHTSDYKVVKFLSRFTEWIPYFHKVKAMLSDGRLVTLPVNRETSQIVGPEKIIDTFYRPYTRKMWGLDIEQLDPSILQRIPVRDDMNENYFPNDGFQALPKDGYTEMVRRMLDHDNIKTHLSIAFDRGCEGGYDHIFNSMAIDEYFDFCFGNLPYRSIRFHHSNLPVPRLFPVATVNFTHDAPFTRVTEWKNFPGNASNICWTSLTTEEPCDFLENNMERHYPVKDLLGNNRAIYQRYAALTSEKMTFIGRCGLYAYLDMHQAVSSAMAIYRDFSSKEGPRKSAG